MKDTLVGKTFALVCDDLSYEGKGVAKGDNLIVFVTSMYPGDEGEVTIDYKRNGSYFGHIKKLTTLSKDRITPLCKVASACGGCVYQAYSYEKEKEAKQKLISEQFRKIAHLSVKINPTIGMYEPYFYRNKIQAPFGYNKSRKQIYGFYRQKSHEIIESPLCAIEDKRGSIILETIKKLLRESGITVYEEKTRSGFLRHVLIRTSSKDKSTLVILVAAKKNTPNLDFLVNRLVKECPFISGVLLNINNKDTNVVLGEGKEILLYGRDYIEEEIDDLTFKVSPKSFFQTNPAMTKLLYRKAMEYAKIGGDDIVLDAYSGVGTIGLIAAKEGAKKVIAVECVLEAVKNAKENAETNGLKNFEIVEKDATEYIEELVRDKANINVLFLDPPRKGSTSRFISAALSLAPQRIIYISCNPSSLARDIASFIDKYEIKEVQPVDMFPRTPHVETVVLLSP